MARVEAGAQHDKKRRRGRGGSTGTTDPSPSEATRSSKVSPAEKQQQQRHKSVLIQLSDDDPTWFQYGRNLPGRNATVAAVDSVEATKPEPRKLKNLRQSNSNQPSVVGKYRALGDALYRTEAQLAAKAAGRTADDRWVESTMHRGTLKDRVAAMSVLVSTDPVHKLYALDGLLQLAGCHPAIANGMSGRSGGAGSDPHARQPQQPQPAHSKPNSRVAHMAAQAMEDLFVNSLLPKDRKLVTLDQRPLHQYENNGNGGGGGVAASGSSLSPRLLLLWRFEELVRDRYQSFVQQYLTRTLRDGMDLDKKFCLRAASNLLRTVPEGEGPLLQLLVNKLGDPSRAVAAAAAHELRRILNDHPAMRTVVAREVQQLAHRPNLSARALCGCANFLNGIPLDAKPDGRALAGSLVATYFRLFDVVVGDKANNLEDGELLQSRLLSALLTGVNRAHPFLSKQDRSLEDHLETLYRIAHTTPGASTQALLLLFHVTIGTATDVEASTHRSGGGDDDGWKRRDRFYRTLYAKLSDPAMLGSGKHSTMFFNLLYKALKYDTDSDRALAFAKRILTTSLHCTAPVSAAAIFLVNEITKYHPNLTSSLTEALEGSDALRVLDPTKREPRGALVPVCQDIRVDGNNSAGANSQESRGIKASLWEVALFQHHYHPSVAKFASTVGVPDALSYSGDPLRDFGLQPFLDKFSYRNPKSAERVTTKFGPGAGQRAVGQPKAVRDSAAPIPVNDPSFLKQREVDVHDEFFHKFFVERARRDALKGIVRRKAGPDVHDDDEEAQQRTDEQNALDEAEDWDGSKRFEDWERAWGTDPEEEAFVDSLTQRIIEDSVGGPRPDDLDDEDPDTEGWDDMYNSNDEDDEESDFYNQEEESERKASKVATSSGEGDAFMDDDDSRSDSSGSGSEQRCLEGEEAVTSFARHGDSDHDEETDASDGPGDDDISLLCQSDEDDMDPVTAHDDELGQEGKVNPDSRRKKPKAVSTFAPLEEYEDRITESWLSLGRSGEEIVDTQSSSTDAPSSSKRRKRKKH